MDSFRYLAAAIAAALNGAYEDAGKIFSYAIRESDAKSLMSELARFATEQHVASNARRQIKYDEAEQIIENILRTTKPNTEQTGENLIPVAYDPQRGQETLSGRSFSAGPGVGQETMQDIPQDRIFDKNPPVSRDQGFESLDKTPSRTDRARLQRNKRKMNEDGAKEKKYDDDGRLIEDDSSVDFADFPESSDDAKKQTGDSPLSIVDGAIEHEEQEREAAMSASSTNRRHGSRLARAITISLSASAPEFPEIDDPLSMSDGMDPEVMNHPENTDRSDWVDENDLITSGKPVRVNKEVLDEFSDDTPNDESEDELVLEDDAQSKSSSGKIGVLSESYVFPNGVEETEKDLLQPVTDEEDEDDGSEDLTPDPDIPGAPAIPLSFE